MTYDAWLLEILIAQDLALLLEAERGQKTVALILRTCVLAALCKNRGAIEMWATMADSPQIYLLSNPTTLEAINAAKAGKMTDVSIDDL